MPIVMCPSCGRYNNCPTQRPKGLYCEICRASLDPGGEEPDGTPAVDSTAIASAPATPETIDIAPVGSADRPEVSGRQMAGRLVAMTGMSLMTIGGLVVFGGVRNSGFGVWGIVAGTVLGVIGGTIWNLGQRMAAKSVAQAEADDPRPAILLLRRFRDDNRSFGVRDSASPFVPYSSMERQTFEQMVAEQFAKAGPVIAIGKPGEFLPSLGAARTYVGDDEWQAQIEIYLQRAGRVVMILGRIDGENGLAWELRNIWATVPAARVVFVLPPVDEDEARLRWNALAGRCDGRVPPFEGGELVASFDSDGVCEVVRAAPGDRIDRSREYAEALDRIARIRPDLMPASDVELVAPPTEPKPSGPKRIWPYRLASWQTMLACFVAFQVCFGMCLGLGGPQGGLPRSAAPHSAADYAMGIATVPGLVFLGGFFASIFAYYDRKVNGVKATDAVAGTLATGMLVSWLGALVFTGLIVVAAFKTFVLGIPSVPHRESATPSLEREFKSGRIE